MSNNASNIIADRTETLRRIRLLLVLFIVCMVLSGVTAFPIETELRWLAGLLGAGESTRSEEVDGIVRWIVEVRDAIIDTNTKYPYLAYGTDWLAFAHLVIALLFIGPLRDPVRNRWVVEWGLVACAGIFPLAFIGGAVREIPFYWQLIDCSFGVGGALLLWPCRRMIRTLEARLPA